MDKTINFKINLDGNISDELGKTVSGTTELNGELKKTQGTVSLGRLLA